MKKMHMPQEQITILISVDVLDKDDLLVLMNHGIILICSKYRRCRFEVSVNKINGKNASIRLFVAESLLT